MAPRFSAVLGLVVAAAMVLPATAATPKAGSFSGSTKQGKSVSFKVTSGGKVKRIKFGFRGRCENGATTTGTVSMPGPFPVNGGKFNAQSAGGTFVRGTFTSRTKARGRLRQRSSSFDPISLRQVTCTSGKVRWSAKR
jgi:hypothetical protein